MASQVEQIKEKLGIVDVVSQYIKLEKAGINLKAKCPFHNEKTPSFFVSPARNSYYCFGCGAKGDIFSFVEQFEGVDFTGALKILGEKAGVPIVYEKQDGKKEKSRLYSIMEDAVLFFEENLKKEKKVLEYLKKRGLDERVVKIWRIGYSPASWNALYEHFKGKYSTDEIEKVGLIKKSEKSGDYYDRFRGRIMFPISDNSGRVIAFSGRIFNVSDEEAKYINSPETALFSKSKILYGLDKAKFSIRKLNFSIIVEGQMDLLLSHKAGFTNTVALSGTALTVEQAGLLQKLSGNVILAFDSDSAGISSSGKSAMLMLALGMDVRVAYLKEGDDPAEVINRDKNEWKKAIKNSKHIIDFYLDVLSEKYSPAGGDKRKLRLKVGQIVLPYIKKIANKIDQEHFISVVAHKLEISEDAVREEVDKITEDNDIITSGITGGFSSEEIYDEDKNKTELQKISSIEDRLAGIIFWQRNEKKPVIDVKSLIKELERIAGYENALRILKHENLTDRILFEEERAYENPKKLRDDLDELLQNLEQEYIKMDRNKILIELKSAEAENDSKKISKALKKYKELSDKLLNIKTK